MPDFSSVAEWFVPFNFKPPEGFRSRLAGSTVATALDAVVLAIFGPAAYACASISFVVPVAFLIVSIGLFASLGRMWFLTVESWNSH